MKKNPIQSLFLSALWILLALPAGHVHAAEKTKFKRALIIAGGGISPAVGLGILAGVRSAGWTPDIVITTCGSSMAAAIDNSFPGERNSLEFAKSRPFQEVLNGVLLKAQTVFDARKAFTAVASGEKLPDLFGLTILTMPEDIEGKVTPAPFSSDPNKPRYIMLAARAHFGPGDVGKLSTDRDRFTQVYFTDPDTATLLQGFESPIRLAFPDSRVALQTEVITDVLSDQAARASIADPILINPALIRGFYYFTGAIDLRPVELAMSLADEVVSTYPDGVFTDYEESTIVNTFGFSPRKRTLQTISPAAIKWIDASGLGKINFDPEPVLLNLINRVPTDPKRFQAGIQRQFDFGYQRGKEAIEVQKNSSAPTRSHLRKPLSPDCDATAVEKKTCVIAR